MNTERLVFLQGFEKLPMTGEQRKAMLTGHPWAEALGLDQSEIEQLASFLIPYRGRDGAVAFRRGDQESFMCLICSGEIKIFENEGKEPGSLLSSVGPGNTVGEMALIDGEPRSAFAYAEGETVLFVMTRSNFMRVAGEHPVVWGKLLFSIAKSMSQRLRKTNDILAEYLHQ